MNKLLVIIQYIVLFVILEICGCTYYLEDVHSIGNIPNNSPIPIPDRKKKDISLNIQLQGSCDASEKAFNDGNFTDKFHYGGQYSAVPYSSLNIKLRHTVAMGLLDIDYSLFNKIFVYSKMGSGISMGKHLSKNNFPVI